MNTDLEMKKVNEEILAKWRALGFLAGLKMGSQMEWRCAKSMDLAADYIINNREFDDVLAVVPFPVIRRTICSARPRLNRILKAEEVIEPIKIISVSEMLEAVNSYKNFKPTARKYILRFLEYFDLLDKTVLDAIKSIREIDIKPINAILDCDIEAELISIYSQYLNIIYTKKDEG